MRLYINNTRDAASLPCTYSCGLLCPVVVRFGNDAGVGVGLTGGPCFFASLYIVSKNGKWAHTLPTYLYISHESACWPMLGCPKSGGPLLPVMCVSCHVPPALLRSLLHTSLLCSVSTAVHHFLCFPFSDIPSRSTSFARFTTFTSKFFVLSFRLLLPWPDRLFSIITLLIYECFMWALTELPLFSTSFTLGEAVLVLQTLALSIADLLLVTLLRVG